MTTKLYTIKKGDTLWDIAKKFTGSGINYKLIAKLNNISNPNLIYVGATIKIPTKEEKLSLPSKYVLKTEKEKLKLPLYIFQEADHSAVLAFKHTTSKPKDNKPKDKTIKVHSETLKQSLTTPKKVESKSTITLKLYEFKLLEPFVPTITLNRETSLRLQTRPKINTTKRKPVEVTHDYIGNPIDIITPENNTSTSKVPVINSPIDNFFRGLYNRARRVYYNTIPEEYRTPIDLLRSGNIEGLSSYINTAYDRRFSNNYKGVLMNQLNMEKAKETPKYRLSEPSIFDVAQAQLQQRTGILGKSISFMNVPYDINVKDFKWHYRLRGDMSPVQHTYGVLAPIFHNMTDKHSPIRGSYNGIIFNPKTGELSVEPDLNKVPDGWLINNTWVLHFNVKGMRKDSNGNLVMVVPENKEYRHNFTAEYELTDGTRKLLNIFTDVNNRDPNTLGAKAGGHFLISAQPKKGNRLTRLIHGSLQQLSDAIDRLKANTNTDYVTVYPLDAGSFSMGYIPPKAIGPQGMLWIDIESSEFNKYQNQNPQGSSGFMPVLQLPAIPDTTYITN